MSEGGSGGLDESRSWLGSQGLMRPVHGRAIAGVCAGLARRFGVPVLIVRLGMVLAALIGPGIFAYPILWILMPEEREARI